MRINNSRRWWTIIYNILTLFFGTSLVAQTVKHLPTMQETWFKPWVGKISWRRKWQPTPVFLPGKSHGRRGLVGYSPWGRKELDKTEQLHFTSLHSIWGPSPLTRDLTPDPCIGSSESTTGPPGKSFTDWI